MHVRKATEDDLEAWASLRIRLWPDEDAKELRDEVAAWFDDERASKIAFVATSDRGDVCGLLEGSLRTDYVNGCKTSPVAFLEAVYVLPAARRSGVASKLCAAFKDWACKKGCQEMASDALLDNAGSHAFHEAVGFEETERVVYFRKSL